MPFVDILHFRGDLIDRETIFIWAGRSRRPRTGSVRRAVTAGDDPAPVKVRGGG